MQKCIKKKKKKEIEIYIFNLKIFYIFISYYFVSGSIALNVPFFLSASYSAYCPTSDRLILF